MWESTIAAQACRLLELHEGRRNKPYLDTVGKETIGIGFNLTDVGLLDDEIDVILRMRLGKLYIALSKALPWFDTLDQVRQLVLLDMSYNMGMEPFDNDKIKDWPNFLQQIKTKQYTAAAENMLTTKWAKQVGSRAKRLADMMRTGESWEKS